MLNVVSIKQNTKLLDIAFSFVIRVTQKTVINGIGVSIRKIQRKKKLQDRIKITSSDSYEKRLIDLGLIPERLWWGPMTLTPIKAQVLLDEIEKQPPQHLLEVGSGTSSALFAAAGEKYDFDVLSLENYRPTVKYVEYLLNELTCSRRLTIQLCDLVRRKYANGDKYRWYNANLNSVQGPIDFVLIDGPMSSLVGRNGALPEIIPFLAEDHRIFLDDSSRKHERKCIEEWKMHYPQLIVEKPKEKCSLAKIRIPNIKSIQSQL